MVAGTLLRSVSSFVSPNAVFYKYLSLILCCMSICLFLFKLGLLIFAVVDPCETIGPSSVADVWPNGFTTNRPPPSWLQETTEVCLDSSELFFRCLLMLVTGVILTGHFAALITEDSLIIGMVIGSEWLNIASELMTKVHGAFTLFEEFDLKLLSVIILTFVLDFSTAVTFIMWVLRAKCFDNRSDVERKLRSGRNARNTTSTDCE